MRWCLWLIVLAGSISFVAAMRAAPQHFALIALVCFCLSMSLSLWVLTVETKRAGISAGGRPRGQSS